MKYLKQFGIILTVSMMGEALHTRIPLPVPASIYGLVLLFAGLVFGLLREEDVRETGHFLVEIMAVMFIPAGVGLMKSFEVLKPLLLPYLVMIVISGLAVMLVSGRVTQRFLRKSATGNRWKRDGRCCGESGDVPGGNDAHAGVERIDGMEAGRKGKKDS